MPRNKLSDYVQLAVAVVRAAYGDFSGLAVQVLKHLPQIVAILVALIIILIILPVLFIQSLFTGDSRSPSGNFSELAIEALQYNKYITRHTVTMFLKKSIMVHIPGLSILPMMW